MAPAPPCLSNVSLGTRLASPGLTRLLADLEANSPLPTWFEELERIYNLISTEDWAVLRKQYDELLDRLEAARESRETKLHETLTSAAVESWRNLMYIQNRRDAYVKRWWKEAPAGLSEEEYVERYKATLFTMLEPLSAEDAAYYEDLGLSLSRDPSMVQRRRESKEQV